MEHPRCLVGTPWRYQKLQAGGGWILDGEVHYVDFLRKVFGDVNEVYAKTKNLEPTRYLDPERLMNPIPSNVEDVAFALLTFTNGLIGNMVWSNAMVGEPTVLIKEPTINHYYGNAGSLEHKGFETNLPEELEIRTRSGGHISNSELEERFMNSLSRQEKNSFFPLGITNFYAISFYDFLESITAKKPPEVDGKEALASQAICEAIYESSIRNQPVSVDDVLNGRIDTYQREINEYWNI